MIEEIIWGNTLLCAFYNKKRGILSLAGANEEKHTTILRGWTSFPFSFMSGTMNVLLMTRISLLLLCEMNHELHVHTQYTVYFLFWNILRFALRSHLGCALMIIIIILFFYVLLFLKADEMYVNLIFKKEWIFQVFCSENIFSCHVSI